MIHACKIQCLIVTIMLTLNISAQEQRSDIYVYGETTAMVESEFNWDEPTMTSEKEAETTTIKSSVSGDELIINGELHDVEQVLLHDMNGMLFDTKIAAQSKRHMIVSMTELQEGSYILSLERASGHESFQVTKSK